MSKSKYLVIVESPGKVKKIQSFLGSDYRVMASLGHVRDLPPDRLGVAVTADFTATWETVKGKAPLIKRLTKAMQAAEVIYLATDPDREGEAIADHLLKICSLPPEKPVHRVTFRAITREAVHQAVAHPHILDQPLVAAQHARRKLDRLVGYLVSPLACQALAGRYSAGRVQSPALRLVVERENAIAAFVPETYFTLSLLLSTTEGPPFPVKLTYLQGQMLPLKQAGLLKALLNTLQSAQYRVNRIETETVETAPLPPLITSSLQQAASRTLGLSPEKTMQLAQALYEAGLITYLRTDALFIAPEAQTAAWEYIGRSFGESYLPIERRTHPPGAHEAIRPTDVQLTPEQVNESIGDGAALYGLIWRRFMASQMAAARTEVTTVTITAQSPEGQSYRLTLEARGNTPVFDGFRRVYPLAEATTDPLPVLEKGQVLTLHKLIPQQQQTRPPQRYNEADLIQALEQRGIGRPSTYATILSHLKQRGYVQLEQRRLMPTPSGIKLADYLDAHFAPLLTDDYTAQLESQLDAIAAGKGDELTLLQTFWQAFHPLLVQAAGEEHAQPTGEACPPCGAALVYRTNGNGPFIACTACRYTQGVKHTPLLLKPLEA